MLTVVPPTHAYIQQIRAIPNFTEWVDAFEVAFVPQHLWNSWRYSLRRDLVDASADGLPMLNNPWTKLFFQVLQFALPIVTEDNQLSPNYPYRDVVESLVSTCTEFSDFAAVSSLEVKHSNLGLKLAFDVWQGKDDVTPDYQYVRSLCQAYHTLQQRTDDESRALAVVFRGLAEVKSARLRVDGENEVIVDPDVPSHPDHSGHGNDNDKKKAKVSHHERFDVETFWLRLMVLRERMQELQLIAASVALKAKCGTRTDNRTNRSSSKATIACEAPVEDDCSVSGHQLLHKTSDAASTVVSGKQSRACLEPATAAVMKDKRQSVDGHKLVIFQSALGLSMFQRERQNILEEYRRQWKQAQMQRAGEVREARKRATLQTDPFGALPGAEDPHGLPVPESPLEQLFGICPGCA